MKNIIFISICLVRATILSLIFINCFNSDYNENQLISVNSNNVMTIQFSNQTKIYDSSKIYIWIYGKNTNGKLSNLDTNGNLTPMVEGDNASNYFYRLDKITGYQIPDFVDSGRIYIAFDKPMNINFNMDINTNVGIALPNIEDSNDASINQYWDFIEFTILPKNPTTLTIDTGQVDMYGLSLWLSGYAVSSDDSYFWVGDIGIKSNRNIIYQSFCKFMPDISFKRLANYKWNAGWRITAPLHGGFKNGLEYQNYWSNYVEYLWNFYMTNMIEFTAGGSNYCGWVIDNIMYFSNVNNPKVVSVLSKPNSEEVWGCEGILNSGNSISTAIQAQIGAAIHRSIMQDSSNLYNVSNYYKLKITDYYAEYWHTVNINNKAYGFSYDDVNFQDSTLVIQNPRGIVINILW